MWFCQLSIGRRFVHASVVTCCLTELLVIGQLKVTIIHRFAQSKGHNYSIRCWLEQGLITFCPILKLSHSFRWLGRYGRYTGVYAPTYPFSDAPSRLCSLTRKVGLSCWSTDLDALSACRSANIKRSHVFILKNVSSKGRLSKPSFVLLYRSLGHFAARKPRSSRFIALSPVKLAKPTCDNST